MFRPISTSNDSVSGRLVHGDKPHRRVDNKAIANDWSDLTDGKLAVPLSVDENGIDIKTANAFDLKGFVWTGTTAAGATTTETCGNWTLGTGSNPHRRLVGDLGILDPRNRRDDPTNLQHEAAPLLHREVTRPESYSSPCSRSLL